MLDGVRENFWISNLTRCIGFTRILKFQDLLNVCGANAYWNSIVDPTYAIHAHLGVSVWFNVCDSRAFWNFKFGPTRVACVHLGIWCLTRRVQFTRMFEFQICRSACRLRTCLNSKIDAMYATHTNLGISNSFQLIEFKRILQLARALEFNVNLSVHCLVIWI